ncbi:hypothetical protein [Mycobacterium sp. GA-2829]|uniref:Rv0361 family membrane protein n=1 Tax=Mycobacterium sp. GA-2829 TaxID=1772283 RepID=UPI000B32C5C5|nr:hypothetical protein [Mycobacterium sp. GA-2829]
MPVESMPTVPFRFRTPMTTYPDAAPPPPVPHGGQAPSPAPYSEGPGQPPRNRRKRVVVVIGVAGALLAAGGASFGGLTWMKSNNEKTEIRSLFSDFAAAVDSGDPTTVAQHLCAEEAAALTRAVGGEESTSPAPPASGSAAAVTATADDIAVHGDVASAVISRGDGGSGGAETLYFSKENGAWTVCMAAKDDMPTG